MNWQRFVFESWWVWTFAIVAFGLYEQGAMKLEREIVLLEKEADSLKAKIKDESRLQQELRLQVTSQNDPRWIELVLIRALGVIPEGTTKVYYQFKDEEKIGDLCPSH